MPYNQRPDKASCWNVTFPQYIAWIITMNSAAAGQEAGKARPRDETYLWLCYRVEKNR